MYRGGAVQLCRMAIAQKRMNHEVYVICNQHQRSSKAEREKNLLSWKQLSDTGIPVSPLQFNSLWGVYQLRRTLMSGDIDIVHAHRNQALVACWRALWKLSKPSMIAQRATTAPMPKNTWKAFCSPRSKAIIAVAEAVKKDLVMNNVDEGKIHVVYGSVDLDEFVPRTPACKLKDKLGIPRSHIIFGSLSAYRHAKGFHYLIPALRMVMKNHKDLHAVFLGTGIPKKVGPTVKKLGIENRCHFVDHQTNVAEWLSIMDCTIMAAIDLEGLSGVLRESLAMEIPVISTDCAGNSEIVANQQTGLLVPKENIDALVQAMEWALANQASMKDMARRGRRWVQAKCSPEIQANRIVEVYNQVLKL
jgi:glycosyltransferase involved in cell wall biosynthesis